MRAVLPLLLLVGCASGVLPGGSVDPGPEQLPAVPPDPARSFWIDEGAVQVDIELPPEQWEALRHEGRSWVDVLGGDCLAEPFDSPYLWYEAEVRIDGEQVEGAGLRKKGFLGSLSDTRPSLKVDFGHFGGEDEPFGLRAFALNNGAQDPSLLRTCLGFQTFIDLSVPAPRCRVADVRVNGQGLGPYAFVEDIDDDFLVRNLGEGGGALWEGTLSDFREEWMGTFDADTEAAEDKHGALEDIAAALLRPDDEGLDPIGAVVDLDAFFTFWAAEVLLGHWDGYSANTNNYFVHVPEGGGPARFLPWGPDAVLSSDEPFGEEAPVHITGVGAVANRLWSLPEGRDRYESTLRSMVEQRWDTETVIARIDLLEELAGPSVPDAFAEPWADAVATLRSVAERRAEIVLDALDDGIPESVPPMRDAVCLEEVGHIEGTFVGQWGTLGAPAPFEEGDADLVIEWQGDELPLIADGVIAGTPPERPDLGRVAVLVAFGGDAYGLLLFDAPLQAWVSGTSLPFDQQSAVASMLYQDAQSGGEWTQAAFLDEVVVDIEIAEPWDGGALRGSVVATALGWGG